MSTHPNARLMVVLTPDGLSRKTMRDILESTTMNDSEIDEQVVIDGVEYRPLVMEGDYDESWQIAANEGDLVFHDLFTYGYGESMSWDELEKRKHALEFWAVDICEKHNCTYDIRVSANYW